MPDPITGTIIGGTVIGAGATVYSAKKAAKSQQQATTAATASQKEAIDTEWKIFQQSRTDYAPWREAGREALAGLREEMIAGPGEFRPEEQPGYKFGFEEFVEKPYVARQAARGKRLSGETLKGLTKYAQDYAETSYDNFLQRYYQRLTPYQSVAGVGLTALAGPQKPQVAGLQQGMGQILAQGAQAQGAIQTGMAAGIGGAAQQGMGSYMDYAMMKKMGAFD